MPKYYEKSVGNGEKLLYDSNGKCIGRGVTDKSGKTIYSGAGGYVGKSYEIGHGTVKHFDSDNNFVGSGIKRGGVSPIQSSDDSTSHAESGGKSHKDSKTAGDGCFVTICLVVIIGLLFALLKILSS